MSCRAQASAHPPPVWREPAVDQRRRLDQRLGDRHRGQCPRVAACSAASGLRAWISPDRFPASMRSPRSSGPEDDTHGRVDRARLCGPGPRRASLLARRRWPPRRSSPRCRSDRRERQHQRRTRQDRRAGPRSRADRRPALPIIRANRSDAASPSSTPPRRGRWPRRGRSPHAPSSARAAARSTRSAGRPAGRPLSTSTASMTSSAFPIASRAAGTCR
mgnify:CR=1 FL=1